MTLTTTPAILDCGHAPTPDTGCGTGYGRDDEGRLHCYACCAAQERADLTRSERAFLYLSGDRRKVTGWTGNELGTVTSYHESRPARRCYVKVRDVWGQMWHGTGPLESGTYVRLHRSS